jgi:hypothetical protein
MKSSDAAPNRNIGVYFLTIPLLTLPVVWSLGISAHIRQQYDPAIPQWLLVSVVAGMIVGMCWAFGHLLQTDAGRKSGEIFMICLLFPLWAIPFGGIYLWASDRIARGREPATTSILGVGLGITVFGFGTATAMTLPHMLLVFAGSLLGLVALRLLTRHGMGLMRFGPLHFLTFFAAMAVASMEDQQRKNERERLPPKQEVKAEQR